MPFYRNSNYVFIYLAVEPRLGPGPWPQWGLPWARSQAGTGPGPRPGPAAPTEAMDLGRAWGPPPNIYTRNLKYDKNSF